MNSFPIETGLSPLDLKTLLTIKDAVKNVVGEYNYFEVGSHKGGTLVPFLTDNYCRDIFSVDDRPIKEFDGRGFEIIHIGNTTEAMVKRLARYCSQDQLKKLLCCDGTADSTVTDAALIGEMRWFDLYFLSGRSTNDAIISDFEAAWKTAKERAVFIINNAHLLAPGIAEIMKTAEKRHLIGYPMPEHFFVIEKNLPIHMDPDVYFHSIKNGHVAFTSGLLHVEGLRQFYNSFSKLRTLIKFIQGKNIFWGS